MNITFWITVVLAREKFYSGRQLSFSKYFDLYNYCYMSFFFVSTSVPSASFHISICILLVAPIPLSVLFYVTLLDCSFCILSLHFPFVSSIVPHTLIPFINPFPFDPFVFLLTCKDVMHSNNPHSVWRTLHNFLVYFYSL